MAGTILTLGPMAQGVIEPSAIQQEAAADLTERLQRGDFYIKTNEQIARQCIDGRSPFGGFSAPAPNAAGGTETILIASELLGLLGTTGDMQKDFETLLYAMRRKNLGIGGHSDGDAAGQLSGCGATDQLPSIIEFIARHGDVVRGTVQTLGVIIDAALHARIVENAQHQFTYTTGAEMLSSLRRIAGDSYVAVLEGKHKEVNAVVNTQPHTTLDRATIQRVYSGEVQAFNIDVWAFEAMAKAVTSEYDEARQLVGAMMYFNVAAAFVLGGPGLRVIVR